MVPAMPYRTRMYNRDELYKLVWSEPMTKAATAYGVSDVALAKMCRELDVPVPNRGYWQKVAAGQKLEQKPLPELTPYTRREASVTRWENENGEFSPLPKTAQDRIDAERDVASKILVLNTLDRPHALVRKAAEKLRRGKPDVDGFVWSRSDTLDVKVTPANLGRALRILDALVKALAARKLVVEVVQRSSAGRRSQADDGTRVRVLDEWLAFRLYERYSLKERPPDWKTSEPSWLETRTRKVPNGKLVLEVTNRTDLGYELHVGTAWSDDRRPLDEQLNEFVAGLFLIAEELKRDRARLADQRRAEAELEGQRRRAEERVAQQRKRDQELCEVVSQWRLADDIRKYVEEVRAIAQANTLDVSEGSSLGRHILEALNYAARIDPLRELRSTSSPPV
jgi:hypothetical protein